VRSEEHELEVLVIALAAIRAGHDLIVALLSAGPAVEVDDDEVFSTCFLIPECLRSAFRNALSNSASISR